MIQDRILELAEYGVVTGLMEESDRTFVINQLMELFELDDMEDSYFEAFSQKEPMTQEKLLLRPFLRI